MSAGPGERRRFQRVPFRALVTLTTPKAQWRVNVIDISLKGMLLEAPADLPADAGECDVELELGEVNLIRLAGRIARRMGEKMGVEITAIDLDSLIELRRLLELNLGDPGLVERDLARLLHASEQ